MTADEQSRFLKSVKAAMEMGYGKPFEKLMRAHGYHSPSEFMCQHRMETFVAWHRVFLHEFEKIVQDAHEKLYGNRNIGVPYWDWTAQIFDSSISKDVFLPEVQDDVDALSTPATLQAMFGDMPAAPRPAKIWEKGFKLPSTEKIFKHKVWHGIKAGVEELAEVMMTAREAGYWTIKHAAVNDFLEDMHNGIHVACNKPMNKLDMSPYVIYFWVHHANVDRLWESYLTQRESLDGSRLKVMDEFANDDPVTYQSELVPFTRGLDNIAWTAGMTFNPGAFNMGYDRLFHPDTMYLSEKAKAKMAAFAAIRNETGGSSSNDSNISGVSVLQVPVATQYAKIRFAKKGEHCTLTLYEDSFNMHFFLKKKNEPLKLPSYSNELDSTPEWVGMGTHFGGMEVSEPYHIGEVELIIPVEGSLADYEVEYLFEKDEGDEDEGEHHPLLKTPDFWTITVGCDGKTPKPDKSWVTLTLVDE